MSIAMPATIPPLVQKRPVKSRHKLCYLTRRGNDSVWILGRMDSGNPLAIASLPGRESPLPCVPVGRVAELADAQDLGSCGVIRAGSTPVAPTTLWLSPEVSKVNSTHPRQMSLVMKQTSAPFRAL